MLYIDKIESSDKLLEILRKKNKFFEKISNLKEYNILRKIILRVIFLIYFLINKNIKKTINFIDADYQIDLIYLMNLRLKKIDTNKRTNVDNIANKSKIIKNNKISAGNITSDIINYFNNRNLKSLAKQIKNANKEKKIVRNVVLSDSFDFLKTKINKENKMEKTSKKNNATNIKKEKNGADINGVNKKFKNYLYEQNINILDGRFLYEFLIYRMIEYISIIQKRKLELYEISFLVNNKTELRMDMIKKSAIKCKVVNIITNNSKQFEKFALYLKNEYGVIINITKNVDKSLLKSDIVVNYDFPIEIYKKYNIPIRGIIFNIEESIKENRKNFNGINITDYMITLPSNFFKINTLGVEKTENVNDKKVENNKENEKSSSEDNVNEIDKANTKSYISLNNFNNKLIYESLILKNNGTYDAIINQIKKDDIKIKYFIGNNGKISGREFIELNSKEQKITKSITKNKNPMQSA